MDCIANAIDDEFHREVKSSRLFQKVAGEIANLEWRVSTGMKVGDVQLANLSIGGSHGSLRDGSEERNHQL